MPDGSSLHYQLFNAEGDKFDMQLRSVDSTRPSYLFHIAQSGETSGSHATLHEGLSASDVVVASSTYSSSSSGTVEGKEWFTPVNTIYAQIEVQGRTLRWYKTYNATKKLPFMTQKPGYIEWVLQDVSGVPAAEAASLSAVVGNTLATLKLEAPNPELMKKGVQASKEGSETGNLVWIRPLDAELQHVATLLLLSLWHRDRQIHLGQPLGPGIDVPLAARTLGTTYQGALAGAAGAAAISGSYF